MNVVTLVSNTRKAAALSASLAAGLIFGLGCATKPPDALRIQLAQTDTSIAQAEQAGAAQNGLTELQQAKDKRAGAQDAVKDRDYDKAMQLAQQAQADAQFASRKSEAARANKSATEVERGHETLREETERKSESDATSSTSSR